MKLFKTSICRFQIKEEETAGTSSAGGSPRSDTERTGSSKKSLDLKEEDLLEHCKEEYNEGNPGFYLQKAEFMTNTKAYELVEVIINIDLQLYKRNYTICICWYTFDDLA